jgi:hypothetical protein
MSKIQKSRFRKHSFLQNKNKMWILLFLFLTAVSFSHGKPYDKDIFRNELNELVVHWKSPLGEFFLLKQHQKKIFKLIDNKFAPIQIVELVGNVSLAATIDFPTDITGDSWGNIYVLDCNGQVTTLTPYQQNYAKEVDHVQDEHLLQFDSSDTSLCLRPFKSYMHRNSVSLSSIVATQGISTTGESTYSYTGISVTIGGDVNGDGKADMLIGAYGYPSSFTGRVYLIYGSSSLTNIALGSLTPAQGITITGQSTNSYTGNSVSIGGDVNGDGKADMLIGASQYSSSTGRVYLIYGSSSLTNIALGSLTSTQGITITGESFSSTGISVTIGGDINGDGKADILIGADGNAVSTGRVYLIYGSSSLTNIALESLTTTQGIIITGESSSSTGNSVSIGGDVNGDGKADMLIGAYQYSSSTGRVYLIYGSSSLTNIALGSLTTTQGIIITGESSSSTGNSVSIGGDVNGDGKADMLIGAYGYAAYTGRVYLIYGSSSLTNIALGSLTTTQGIIITGESTNSYTGNSVSIGGDVNGDGKADMLIGASRYSISTGRVYLIYGSSSLTNIALGSLTSTQGIIITGESFSYTGNSVSIGGDVNGDGKAEMLIGAYGYASNTGRIYLIYRVPTNNVLLGSDYPTSQPSSQPTLQPTREPTSLPSSKPSIPTSQPSSFPTNPTNQPSRQPTNHPSGQPTRQPYGLPSRQPTRQPTTQPSSEPSSQPTQQPSMKPTRQPTSQPSNHPTAEPTRMPSSQPTQQPTTQPFSVPTSQPSRRPTVQPTSRPSSMPTSLPTNVPTMQPTELPLSFPSTSPTEQPVSVPSVIPSCQPSSFPSVQPSTMPSVQPSACPTMEPSEMPSIQPSSVPTEQPSSIPSTQPTTFPTIQPSSYPTLHPSSQPTSVPTGQPSAIPSVQPTALPSDQPSVFPSSFPTVVPSNQPTTRPSMQPTSCPSVQPSMFPSSIPSVVPSSQPSHIPSRQPSTFPTTVPSQQPTALPSLQPSNQPSSRPTRKPSCLPTEQPSNQPSSRPTRKPSCLPTERPSNQPSKQPASVPTSLPSGQPTVFPTNQPSSRPSSQPWSFPTTKPSQIPTMQPTTKPSKQPVSLPTSSPSQQPTSSPTIQPSSRPTIQPAGVPTAQPSSLPTRQPSSQPSTLPTSHPSINKKHCFNQSYYSFSDNDCLDCPINSFNNFTGASYCICKEGYHSTKNSSIHDPKLLDCQSCLPGEFSEPGAIICSLCPTGSFSEKDSSKNCDYCPLNLYNSKEGQSACATCPNGRTTSFVGATSSSQCVSPLPNFTMGFFALFLVVVIFSWYIVFGKFHRVSFERKTKTVEPNIEKCRQVLIREEEQHYQHLIGIQEKRTSQNKKYKFISFALISFLLIISSILASFICFTYQVVFTSLILWRGMKVDFQLSPILNLLAEALRGITQYIGFPVDFIFILALPFLYLFDSLASINLHLSSVNITCSGSQAPIELLFNCVILGFLIIVVRSDYQLLFNVLLNNVNQRFLLNNLEQQLDKGNLWFSRYFFVGIIFTGFILINPFQVGLRYCMGFVRLDSFAKNHGIAHEVSEACDKVPGAGYFDSFLGYTSTIFAWWLILPAVYCLAEVVVPKCKKTEPLKKINGKSPSVKNSSLFPADLFIDDSMCSQKLVDKLVGDYESNEEKGEDAIQKVAGEISFTEEHDTVQLRPPQVPKHLRSEFPGFDEDAIARIYRQGYRDRLKEEMESGEYSANERVVSEEDRTEESSYVRNSIHKVTKKMPFLLAFYYYCKEKYLFIISVDLWISNTLVRWIDFLHNRSPKKVQKDRQQKTKQAVSLNKVSAKKPSVKRPGMKELLSLDSEQFLQSIYVYDQAQIKKQKALDHRWHKEQLQNNYTLPSYYELSHAVQEELHEFIIQPFCSFLAFLGIGHFFTQTGRYYWKVVFHNYKVFLLVCLGIWTDEAVEAYDLKETSARLSLADRAFLEQKMQKKEVSSTKLKKTESLIAQPSSRKFSAQLLGLTISRVTNNSTGVSHEQKYNRKKRLGGDQQNFREVLPSIISVLICSRVILFQIVPSLVLFATISMTLASFPLFIFSEFLAEALPPLLIWGEINREMSIEIELKSFIPLDPETRQPLSEHETIRMLTEEYSWRLHLRGTILFWNESRLLQFFHSSLALFFSFLLLIYSPELLIYLVIILALLIPFILSKSLVLLLYLGKSLDLKDYDFPSWLQQNKLKRNTARVEPDAERHTEDHEQQSYGSELASLEIDPRFVQEQLETNDRTITGGDVFDFPVVYPYENYSFGSGYPYCTNVFDPEEEQTNDRTITDGDVFDSPVVYPYENYSFGSGYPYCTNVFDPEEEQTNDRTITGGDVFDFPVVYPYENYSFGSGYPYCTNVFDPEEEQEEQSFVFTESDHQQARDDGSIDIEGNYTSNYGDDIEEDISFPQVFSDSYYSN